jgi:hypothetical protein
VDTYRFDYQASSPGLLKLQVRSTDDLGNIGFSDLVPVSVVTGVIPTITIDSPLSGEANIFNHLDVIPFEITAFDDPGGSISSVTVSHLDNGTPTVLGPALKIYSVSNDQYRYSLDTGSLTAGTKLISVSAVDNRGNVSTDVVEIRLDVVPFSVNFVTQTATNTATNTATPLIASPYVIEGAIGEYSSALRRVTVEIVGIDASTLTSLDWQLQLDDGSAPESRSEIFSGAAEGNGQTSEENGQEGSAATSLTSFQDFAFSGTGILTVTATNTDGVSVQNSLTVFAHLPEPHANLADFVNYIYNKTQILDPSEEVELTSTLTLEQAAINEINTLGGDTAANRAAFAATLFPPYKRSNSLRQTVALVYKTLTGQWPTQAQLLAGVVTILQDTTVRTNQTRESSNGSITRGGTQTFSFNYSEGDEVSIIVTPDSGSVNILLDPTLTVTRPDGSSFPLIDDSVNPETGIYGLNPALSFVASQTGTYTATVGGYANLYSGDFTIESVSTAIESNIDILAARALVESLKGSYNGANGFLADAATGSSSAADFVAQIYLNKHELDIMTFNSAFLGGRLRGVDTVKSTGDIIPGYQSNVVNFVADFALDVDLTTGPYASFTTGDGYPYSKIVYYGRPNNPFLAQDHDANLSFALSALMGIQNPAETLDPTDTVYTFTPPDEDPPVNPVNRTLEEFMALNLEQALAEIFGSVEFADQFVGDARIVDTDSDGITNYYELLLGTDPSDGSVEPAPADSFVARIMVNLGVVDSDKVAAVVDADDDGVSNIAEILLNTDPSNIDDKPTTSALQSEFEFPIYSFKFVRLKSDLITPDMPSVVVECAGADMAFMPVSNVESKLSLAADQSGIGSDYERFVFRVDITEAACGFYRLKVE